MKPKVLSMCSSRNRPTELLRMLKSFDETKQLDSEIVVYISEDDPQLQLYIDTLKNGHWTYFIGQHKFLGAVLNYFACEIFPDCEYYQEVNDDHIYITHGWDKMLVETIEKNGNGWGISHPNKKGAPNDFSPSAYMMSGNIVRAVGWFTLPGLRQNSIDNAIFKFGTMLRRYWYVPDCIIHHKTWSASQRGFDVGAPKDNNSDFIYSANEEEHGSKISETWNYNRDINIVNSLIK